MNSSTLKPLLILCFLLVNGLSTSGKILVIDTLSGYNGKTAFLFPTYRYAYDEHEDNLLSTAQTDLSIDHHPAIVADIGSIQNLQVLLDNKGGCLEFLNLQNIAGDTVRIANWTVYKNGIADTSVNIREVWGKRGNAYQPPLSVTVKKKVVKHKGLKQINNIQLNINGEVYDINIITSQATEVISYSG